MSKPKGIWANFQSECWKCAGELTVTNGKPDRHECDFRARNLEALQRETDNPLTLADIDAALDNR